MTKTLPTICCSIVLVIFHNFGFALSNKCATIYSANSYKGSPLSLTDGSKQPFLRQMNFVPQSVHITPGCFLTIFDVQGYKQTLDRDMENLGWFPYRVLDAACCECGGCNDAAYKLDNMCARLFENPRCDSCSGYRLDLRAGDNARNFGPLNNRMTSMALRPGCTLTVFYYSDFNGWRFNFSHSNNMMGENWYKQISSAKCGCPTDGSGHLVTLPTVPTKVPITLPTIPTTWVPITLPTRPHTWPPITLPTVPTTRAPITLPTVPTAWPPITLPTVPTTRAPITLPTVPTTRAPITLLTVPTTWPPITHPTVPTTKAPITLPTVPMTTTDDFLWGSSEYRNSYEEGTNFGGDKLDETINFSTNSSIPSPPEPISEESFFSSEEDSEDSDEDSFGEPSTTTTTTTTTRPPTTTSKTTTTTTEISFGFDDEDEDEDGDDDDDDDDEWWG